MIKKLVFTLLMLLLIGCTNNTIYTDIINNRHNGEVITITDKIKRISHKDYRVEVTLDVDDITVIAVFKGVDGDRILKQYSKGDVIKFRCGYVLPNLYMIVFNNCSLIE